MFRLLTSHGHDLFTFAVPEVEATLGRDPGNDLVLAISGVSRRHALVRRCPGGVEVVDLDSKNGLYVAGRREKRAILTPGLRVQIGEAWLELEELSSEEEDVIHALSNPQLRAALASRTTLSVGPGADLAAASLQEEALRLAYHLDVVGVGVPGERGPLLRRARIALGAESFLSLECERRKGFAIREADGRLLAEEPRLLAALAGERPERHREDVWLRRDGLFLLAGRDSWCLAARFADESAAREPWRKDFLRFLAARFFEPARAPKQLALEEVKRVFALTGGNVSETARRLGVGRPTIYRALELLGLHTPSRKKK